MTMKNMVKWLENKGFGVSKIYEPATQQYLFTIRKDDKFAAGHFKYPRTNDYHVRDVEQRRFLENLVNTYVRHHGGVTDEKKSFGFSDLQGCTLITRNGVRMVVSIDEMNVGPDGDTTFEGHFHNVDGRKGFNRDYPSHDGYRAYVIADEMETQKLADRMSLTIKNVIFNDPATIVFWQDGTKTVVKCQDGDKFDPEKGLAMAIAKKVYGNQGNYCNQLKKWLPKEEYLEIPIHVDPFPFSDLSNLIAEKMHKVFNGIKQSKEPPKERVTFREEMMETDPAKVDRRYAGGVFGCPRDKSPFEECIWSERKCRKCWDREIPEELMRDDI